MLLNYVTVAIRRMRRHAGYTTINVVGLAVGLAVCAWIGLYVADELSYDDFHPTADRLYRVVTDLTGSETVQRFGLSPQPVGPALKRSRPEIESAVRLHDPHNPSVVVGSDHFRDRQFLYAGAAYFEVFGMALVRGDSMALSTPRSVVLTRSTAQAYFGTTNPIGETITADGTEYTVTGILADLPPNTHLQFDGLLSYNTLSSDQRRAWGNVNAYTYVVLSDDADPASLEASISDFVTAQTDGHFEVALGMTPTLRLQHVPNIHLHSDRLYDLSGAGDIGTVWLFTGIALLVLALACVNFVNLATARSLDRAREVGVRKAIGATRRGLAGQFLAESVCTVFAAALLAVGLVAMGLPFVNALSGKSLSITDLAVPSVIAGMVLAIGIVGVVAGSYPALVLSRFQPARVLKSAVGSIVQGRRLRQVLVVFQFAVAVALVIGVAVIARQFTFMQTQDLGFQSHRVLVTDLRPLPSDRVASSYGTIRAELARHPRIQDVSVSGGIPGRSIADGIIVRPEGLLGDETRNVRRYDVGEEYLETLGIDVIAGRDFRPEDREAENPFPVLVNESAVQAFGWGRPEDAVGKTMRRSRRVAYEVVGVIEDYHHFSLRQRIDPMFLRLAPHHAEYAVMHLAPGPVDGALRHVEETWSRLFPGYSSEHFFLDDDFDRQYRAEERLASIFSGFAGLALFIACLGLVGMASFAARKRRREISVRKVLGATVTQVVGLLSRDVLTLVGLGFVVAVPLSYLGASAWLEEFAYRVDLGPWVFLAAGLLVAVLALAAVSVHTVRAALLDPARTLREE